MLSGVCFLSFLSTPDCFQLHGEIIVATVSFRVRWKCIVNVVELGLQIAHVIEYYDSHCLLIKFKSILVGTNMLEKQKTDEKRLKLFRTWLKTR